MEKKTAAIFTILIAAAAVMMCTVSAEAFSKRIGSACEYDLSDNIYKSAFSLMTFMEAPEEEGLVRLDSADREKESKILPTVLSSQETMMRRN